MKEYAELISKELNINTHQVSNTIELLTSGATLPFIARYRKEATGGLDEVIIGEIAENLSRLEELDKRKAVILKTIEEQGALTNELRNTITTTRESSLLEDIYLPYKPKRRTRATIAREAGLEPLARQIMSHYRGDLTKEALKYLNERIKTIDDAITGAEDIIAEQVSEHPTARNIIRREFERTATIESKVIKNKETEAKNYSDYFDKTIKLNRCPSHALLAMRRGESEKLLRVKITIDNDNVLQHLYRYFTPYDNENDHYYRDAIKDSYKRLLEPSIETEFAQLSKQRADQEAIAIFAHNLEQLLLASPLGQKRTMGIDPGFRTGCKIVCLDSQGTLLHNDTIYPHPPQNEATAARNKISRLAEQYKIEAIAIGNGTAGRETESFIQKIMFRNMPEIYVVSENGASIYSASSVAREEFPDYDITVRGAVSIARRLMDPLAELVKIDPKSIGVGQYQHDVDSTKLKKSLDTTVESCVNKVGVEINNASRQLLTYVAGIGPQLAKNIVDYRTNNGAFSCRRDLLNVTKMGAKSFEQCAGFIRIAASKNPLDNSAVHPESYHIVDRMASDLGCDVATLMNDATLRKQINLNRYISNTIGLPTLQDIMQELDKPGRDPRQPIEQWSFDPNIRTINDLHEGNIVDGQVSNITNFGAFVNLGIKENGLLHISQICNRRISSPAEVLHLNQHLQVKILNIDYERKRIQLTLL